MTKAFENVKEELCNATLLAHPRPNTPFVVVSDISDVSIRIVHQIYNSTLEPLGFFPVNLHKQKEDIPPKTANSWHFMLLSSTLIPHGKATILHATWTINLLHLLSHRRQIKLTRAISTIISFISQFTTSIKHIQGIDNIMANTLTQVEVVKDNSFENYIIAENQ